jgi:antitoxin (DNA-binding transcriptional repressor) of toxin-antitoxin stability system
MYITRYIRVMKSSITQFRGNLFKLVDKVIAGEQVEFVHKGVTIRVTAVEVESTKLDRLTPKQIVNPDLSEEEHLAAEKKLQAEMLAEMERDWADL